MPAHPIRFGLQTGQQNVEWKDLVDLWKAADDWGNDRLEDALDWAAEHHRC
ncbi:MAG: hypothetical protein H8E45_08495 [Proteobacteria bacterium]|nr:hypothetical protein [Pseudomonadota bacterium]